MHLREQVRAHRAVRVVPEAEAVPVVARVPAEVYDDAHEDETHEGDDLDAAEPELELAEDVDAEQVHEADYLEVSAFELGLIEPVLTEQNKDHCVRTD